MFLSLHCLPASTLSLKSRLLQCLAYQPKPFSLYASLSPLILSPHPSSANMTCGVRRPSPAKGSDEGYLRYLKPGALARLRDSRISARSHRTGSQIPISLCRTLSPSSSPVRAGSAQIPAIDGFPCFAGRIYGPRCPQRKKLVAAKSVFFLNSNPSSPVSDSPESNIEVFINDILASH